MGEKPTHVEIAGWAGWFLLTALTALVGGIASINAAAFYEQLVQPLWAPPSWLFGPVWSVLYLLMATSVSLVWGAGGFARYRVELGLFVLQLVLNGLWSWLFFAWGMGGVAFIDILLLWITILGTAVLFWRVRPLAGFLLTPYLLWVTFAGALNFTLWQLNPAML